MGQMAKGWICLDYVTIDGEISQSSASVRTVNTSSLRIRQGAGITYEIIGFYSYGEKVEILETKTVDGTIWARTSLGWIKFKYLI